MLEAFGRPSHSSNFNRFLSVCSLSSFRRPKYASRMLMMLTMALMCLVLCEFQPFSLLSEQVGIHGLVPAMSHVVPTGKLASQDSTELDITSAHNSIWFFNLHFDPPSRASRCPENETQGAPAKWLAELLPRYLRQREEAKDQHQRQMQHQTN